MSNPNSSNSTTPHHSSADSPINKEQESKTVTILSGTLGRKKDYTFNSQSQFEEYLMKHNLRGLKAVKPNPSPLCLNDFRELHNGTVYGKVQYSFIDRQFGVSDAGFKGVKYSIDELIPPLFNFFDELNTTIRSSILNDAAYKLSAVASELLDGTVLRIKPNWTVIIDFIVFISSLYELHCSLATTRIDPFNIVNTLISITCLLLMYYVVDKHYDWNYRSTDTEEHHENEYRKYQQRPYYHQQTDQRGSDDTYSNDSHYD